MTHPIEHVACVISNGVSLQVLPNKGMNRTRNQAVYYHRRLVRADYPKRYAAHKNWIFHTSFQSASSMSNS